MRIYLFGNEDVASDSLPLSLEHIIHETFPHITPVIIKPNDEVSFSDDLYPILIDSVIGIDEVSLFDETDIDKITLSPRASVHDFDLGFQLKLLKKMGWLKKWYLIGIPAEKTLDQDRVISILRKLVEQDIHGS
ncbi:hypothetical protein KBD81_04460 [Candidatus Woesebacteria bacterium]|nr:hypothetical protein [Candidatus Woesebacteria bacterium]